LEQRLDSSILRLFHFKPNLMKHSLTRRSPSIKKDNDKGYTIRKKPKKKIRSNPLTSFTPAQIKQMISHGKIFINGKKVKSGNRQINILDKIEVKGFIQNLNHKKKIFSTLPKEGFEANPVHKRKKT
jgi:23S rRNA-/tRNA-specific pseudouridylate synthase